MTIKFPAISYIHASRIADPQTELARDQLHLSGTLDVSSSATAVKLDPLNALVTVTWPRCSDNVDVYD